MSLKEIGEILNNGISSVTHLIETYPATSAGIFNIISAILGAILGAVFDLRNKTISFINKITKNNRSYHALAISIFGNASSQVNTDEARGIPINSSMESALNMTQIDICERVKGYSTKFNKTLDIKNQYEEATRKYNSNEMSLAGIKYTQIFDKIFETFKIKAEEYDAIEELGTLRTGIDYLKELVKNEDDIKIKSQILECEKLIKFLFMEFPLL